VCTLLCPCAQCFFSFLSCFHRVILSVFKCLKILCSASSSSSATSRLRVHRSVSSTTH
jgi:hypothetical protein